MDRESARRYIDLLERALHEAERLQGTGRLLDQMSWREIALLERELWFARRQSEPETVEQGGLRNGSDAWWRSQAEEGSEALLMVGIGRLSSVHR